MNLFELLKQFKNIEADPEFTEKSRRIVLASPRLEPQSTHGIVLRIFETAGSLVIAGLLIFAVVGGYSGVAKYFSPVSFAGIDPVALHAEADAIDMQINLADMNYVEGTESTASTAPMASAPLADVGVSQSTITAGGGAVASGTPGRCDRDGHGIVLNFNK